MGEANIGTTPESGATRERLMQEAMRLLAQEGFKAVSLRRIVLAAGARNPSALHYHFGTRSHLISSITDMLREQIEPPALRALADLERQPDYRARDVVEAVFGPVMALREDPAYGRDAVQFLARLGWDYGKDGQELSAALHRRMMLAAVVRLRALMPEVDEETLQFRLILNMNNVYYGLAYRSYMKRSPFGALSLADPAQGERLRRLFIDYMEAGLRGAQ